MADIKKQSIGNSMNYTIGGKNYNASDMFHMQPSQTGNAKTASDISRDSVHKVQSQTDAYQKSGSGIIKSEIQNEVSNIPKLVESIKTGALPESSQGVYRPQTGAVSHTTGNMPSITTGNIKTQSFINNEAVQSVQTQTSAYQKTNAYDTTQDTIHNKINQSPVNVAGVQTGVSMSKGNNSSFFDAVNNIQNKPINIAIMTAGKAKSTLSGEGDLGTQAAGTGIGAGIAGVQVFRTAQKVTEATPVIAKTAAGEIYKAGKGIYQVGLTGGLAAVAVSRTATFIQAGQFQAISHDSLQMLKAQAIATGLNQTALSQHIIHLVSGIQTRVDTSIKTIRYISDNMKEWYRVAKNGVKIVRGVTKGTVSIAIAKKTVANFANRTIKVNITKIKTKVAVGVKKVIVKGVTKGVPFVTFKIMPKMGKFVFKAGIPTIAGFAKGSDNWAVQGVGHAITTTDMGIKTAVKGAKVSGYAVKTAVKGTYKTGKGAIAAGKFIKNNGLRAAWKAGRKKMAGAAAKAGKNVAEVIINSIKLLGKKILIPLLIIVVIVMAFSGVIMVPVTSISAIFSSMFSTSDTGTDYDIRAYLGTIIPPLSADFKQDLADQMQDSWSNYDIVRFYSNVGSDDVIDPTLVGISSVFPTDEELLNIIQPIFNAVILMDYDLEPTEAQAKTLANELFDKLFTVTTTTSVEYCGQDLGTGEGTTTTHSCGSVHALSNCPNSLTGTHSSYTCDVCCYYYCSGHTYTCGDLNCSGHTNYCSGCEFDCNGYSYCGSHNVISYMLMNDGIYALEAEYFLDPIEDLSIIGSRTDEQEIKLQELKDYYEIFIQMMSLVSINYGGGMTMADLANVEFIRGTRTENQAVIDLALSQVGQMGGQPYWSYYGFTSRVEWCACFVNWCMRNTPSASGSYPYTSNNAYCQTVADYFKSLGQWGDKNYTDLAAGDTIFFDWQVDGHTDHIGLVIGRDANNVYTVEGNSGDAVKIKSYPIGSSVIYGYGLMNY